MPDAYDLPWVKHREANIFVSVVDNVKDQLHHPIRTVVN